MKVPTLNNIIECLIELDVKKSYKIEESGLYCPDISEIKYNPKRIITREEFLLTILHECIHHLDMDNELQEKHTELLAEYLISNKAIKTYLKQYFSKEIKEIRKQTKKF